MVPVIGCVATEISEVDNRKVAVPLTILTNRWESYDCDPLEPRYLLQVGSKKYESP